MLLFFLHESYHSSDRNHIGLYKLSKNEIKLDTHCACQPLSSYNHPLTEQVGKSHILCRNMNIQYPTVPSTSGSHFEHHVLEEKLLKTWPGKTQQPDLMIQVYFSEKYYKLMLLPTV